MIYQKDVQFFDDNGYLFLDKFIEKHIIEDIKKEISKTINQIKRDADGVEVLYEDDGSIRLIRNPHNNVKFFKNFVASSFLINIAKSNNIKHFSKSLLTTRKDIENNVKKSDENSRNRGIGGVPFFIINDNYAISGAQESEVFKKIFETCLLENST